MMDAKLVGEWMSQVLGITNVQPVEADLELCMLAAAYGARWARSSESDGDAQLRLDGEELRRCFDIGKSPDVPYPGMSAAFERHYAQSFNDKDWHNEASVWAAAWKAAKSHTAEQSEPVKYRLWFNEAGEPIADIESPDQDLRLATAIQHRDGFRRQLEDLRHEMDDLEADFSEQQMKSVEWAVEKWMAEVANRPRESDYTSHTSYTRALEDYCDFLENRKQFVEGKVYDITGAEPPPPDSGFMKADWL